jgi:hypothetical protein
VSSYHIWAWTDRTTEDFVAVVAAVPENGAEAEVISLSEISPDERSARLRLNTLVSEVKATILARGGEVLHVTMNKMPPERGAPQRSLGKPPDFLVLAEVADVPRRERIACAFQALAHRVDHRQSRRDGLIQRRGRRRARRLLLETVPTHRQRG